MIVLGRQQSPLLLDYAHGLHCPFAPDHLTFDYQGPQPGEFHDHNFEFAPPYAGLTLRAGGQEWILRKIHMHTPAEHLFAGEGARGHEVHLVHSAPCDESLKQDKLVVAVFVEISPHAAAKPTLKALNEQLGGPAKQRIPHTLDPREFLPNNTTEWYRYEGSLTGYPYTEDVSWYVLTHKDQVPFDVYQNIAQHADHAPRAVQDLNRRFVLRSFP